MKHFKAQKIRAVLRPIVHTAITTTQSDKRPLKPEASRPSLTNRGLDKEAESRKLNCSCRRGNRLSGLFACRAGF